MDRYSEYIGHDDGSEDTSKIVIQSVSERALVDAHIQSKDVNEEITKKVEIMLTDYKDSKDDISHVDAPMQSKDINVDDELKKKIDMMLITNYKDDIPVQVVSSQKKISNKPSSSKSAIKRQINVKFMNLRYTKRCYERKIKCQEQEYKEEQLNRQVAGRQLMDKVDEAEELLNKKNGEIVTLYLDTNEQEMMIGSKVNAIATLQRKYEEYKDGFIQSTRASKEKINDYTIELLKEENSIKNKLRQKLRLFGKSELRDELRGIEKLRQILCQVADKMKEEIEYLELGYFKLSHQ